MPTIAEMMVSQAFDSTDPNKAQDHTRAFASGAEIAMKAEELQQRKMQLDMQRKEVDAKKDEMLQNMFVAGTKMDPKTQRMFFGKDGPFRRKRDQLGKTEEFPDQKVDWITSTPENMAKAMGVINDIALGNVDKQAGLATIFNEELYPDLVPYHGELLAEANEASKEYVKNKAAMERQKVEAAASLGKQIQGQEAAGEVTVAKGIADDYVDFTKKGGDGAYDKTIAAYENAIKKLESGEVKLGTKTKKVAGAVGLSNAALTFDDDAKALIQDIQDNVNIRTKSGDPNPATVQIEQIMARSIDPTLKNPANIAKLKAELQRIKKERQERKEGFRSQGFGGPKEGDTKEWGGSVYKVIKGQWVKQK